MKRFLFCAFLLHFILIPPAESSYSPEKGEPGGTTEKVLAVTITTVAQDSTVECDGTGNAAHLSSWLSNNGGAAATATNGALVWSNVLIAVASGCGGTSTSTYEFFAVDDDNVQVSAGTADFIITDSQAPSVSFAGTNLVVECDGTGNSAELSSWLSSAGGYTASDICSDTVSWSNTLVSTTDLCGGGAVYTYRFVAADECGNAASGVSSTFTIQDLTNPVISCPTDTLVDCGVSTDPGNLGSATGDDICSVITGPSWSDVTVTGICTETITRTWTVVDDCNNTATCTQTIMVQDTTAPVVITAPMDVTAECDSTLIILTSSGKATNLVDFNTWFTTGGGAVATDCNDVTWTAVVPGTTVNLCGITGTHTYRFVPSDNCGNTGDTLSATFTIVDVTPPIITSPALDSIVECDGGGNAADLASWLGNNGGASARDMCGAVIWSNSVLQTQNNCGNTSVVTYQFTATDSCGNSSFTTADFTIDDTTGPVWIGGLPGSTTEECDGSGNSTDLTNWLNSWTAAGNATDLCTGANASISTSLINFMSGFCAGESSSTYLFTATDACGNTSTQSATFTIDDSTNPTITCPGAATVNCNADITPTSLGFPTVSDVCTSNGSLSPTFSDASVAGVCPTISTVTRTWTVVDDCMNSNSCTQTITIQDAELPVVVASAQSLTVECDGAGNMADSIAWLASYGGGLASDDCGNITYSRLQGLTTTTCPDTRCYSWSFSAADDCGNSVPLGTAEFCIEDTTAPVLTATAVDSTVECDGSGNAAALASWLGNNGGATVTELCGTVTWSNSLLQTQNNCGNTNTQTYEFRATDACGNFTLTTADFIIEDNTAPVWIAALPGNDTVECDGSGNTVAFNAWIATWEAAANAPDACGTTTISNSIFNTNTTACGGSSEITYEFTATDGCGNTSSQTASFYIRDLTAPSITCPANDTINCNADSSPDALGFATGTDVCGTANAPTYSDVDVNTSACVVTKTRTWTITDNCNNSNTCAQTIRLEDMEAPVILTASQDMTVECDGSGNTADFMNWIDNNGGAIASDDCGTITWDTTLISNTAGCGMSSVLVYDFFANDNCGNSVLAGRATFTIEDTEAPYLTSLPQDTTVNCDGSGNTANLASWLANNGGAVAGDSCSGNNVTWSWTLTDSVSTCSGTTSTRTYAFTVQDECGNSTAAGNAQFIIQDVTAPVWIVALPANDTVECDGSGNTAEFNAWIASWTAAANATETCSNTSITYSIFNTNSAACGNSSEITYEFTASDDCGNTSSQTASFYIRDLTAPSITCPANDTINCNADSSPAALGFASGTDVCGATNTPTYSDVDVNTSACVVTKTRTWTITDNCNNSNTCTQTIRLEDMESPVELEEPTDMTVECDGAGNIAQLQSWLDNYAGAVVTDDCGFVNIDSTQVATPNDCGITGCYTYSFSAEDGCGNMLDLGTAQFCIEDNFAPTITDQALTETVECDGAGNTAQLTAWRDNNGGATATDACAGVIWTNIVANTVNNCGNTQRITYQFTVTDSCGNSASTTADFVIEDTAPPAWVAILPGDTTVECNGAGNIADVNSWITNWTQISNASDVCSNVTIDWNLQNEVPGACPVKTVKTYVFTATDECGNASTQTATFTTQDTTIPTIACPANDTINCSADADPSMLGFATGTDLCGVVNSPTFSDTDVQTSTCVTTRTRTWTITDECGNSNTCNQTIRLEDNQAPTVLASAQDMTVECDGTLAVVDSGSKGGGTAGKMMTNLELFNDWLNNNGGAIATDDCGTLTWTYNVVNVIETCAITGSYEIEFFAEDNCGNRVSADTATFFVVDTEDPMITASPVDTVVACDGTGNIAELNSWLSNQGGAAASDDCSGTLSWSSSLVNTNAGCTGTTELTYNFVVADECGNSIPAGNARFIIEDETAPVWVAILPGNDTVQCDGTGNTAEFNAWIASWTNTANATDACSNVSIVQDLINFTNGNCLGSSEAIYRFTASDECGNLSFQTAIFVIEDDTDPSLTCPANVVIDCDGATDPGTTGFATGSDACTTTATPTYVDVTAAGTCPVIETITRTWTISDQCGNSTTCAQTITTQDNESPAIVLAPQDMSVDCNASGTAMSLQDWLDDDGGAVVTDNCGNVTITNTQISMPVDCSGNDCYEYSFSAMDDCGNITALGNAEFCITDTNAPTFTTNPAPLVVECDGSGNTTELTNWLNSNGGGAATDNCGTVTWTNTLQGAPTQTCGNTTVSTYQFEVSDDCGNTDQILVTFSIIDTQGPTITCPADATNLECSDDSTPTALGSATATDACMGTVSPSFSDASTVNNCLETIVRTWTADDGCGNTSTCVQTIQLQDTQAPVVTNVATAASAECDGTGNFTELTAWLAVNGNMTVTDDCNVVTWNAGLTNTVTGCGNTSVATYEFTATDACGNAVTSTAAFTITDNTPPTASVVPADITVDCNTGNTATLLANWLSSNGGGVASDLCGSVTWSNSIFNITASCLSGYNDTTYQFTATDDCGNASTYTATFSVTDNTAPVFATLPVTTSVECDGAGNQAELNAWLNNAAGATATDNCGNVTFTPTLSSTTQNCGGSQVLLYEFVASDECGNSTSRFAQFNILDVTAPTMLVQASDLNLACGPTSNASLQAWLNNNGGAVASESCSNITWTYTNDATNSACGATGSTVYYFTATDDCGNATTSSATFTISDSADPVFATLPQSTSVECTSGGNAGDLATWLSNNAGATATDDCGSVNIIYNALTPTTGCGNTAVTVYEFTAVDICGNSTTATASFSITDNTAPAMLAQAQNSAGSCDGGNSLETWLNANGGAAAADNCGLVTWSNLLISQSNACVNGVIDYTYRFIATDECGNFSTSSATFTATDNTAPVFATAPQNMTVECDGAGNTTELNNWLNADGNAVITDLCGAVTVANSLESTTPTCNGSTSTAVYRFTATDACGNMSSATASFIINDTTNPTLVTAASDLNVSCSAGSAATISNWQQTAGGAVATDNCSAITWTSAVTNTVNNCSVNGEVIETYLFTGSDGCGNTVTTTATLTTIDNTAPVFTTAPQNMTVQCDGLGNHLQLKTWLAALGGAVATDDCNSTVVAYHLNSETTGCGLTRTQTYEFVALDACGNSSSAFATFSIVDNTPPTFVVQAQNSSADCSSTTALQNWINGNGGASATDVCGGTLTWSNVLLSQNNTCSAGVRDYTYQFTATDGCGNGASTTATFTVTDNTAPIFTTLPQNSVAECDGTGGSAGLNAWIASNAGAIATDACGNVSYTASFVSETPTCGGATRSVTYNFIVTDDCGNQTSQNATYTIVDAAAPTLVSPAGDLTLECTGNTGTTIAAWLSSNGGAIATDACSGLTWTNALIGSNNICGANREKTETYLFTATDGCGNSVNTTATVSIIDNANPVFATLPQNMTIECTGSGNHFQLKAWLQNNGGATATDACNNVIVSYHLVDVTNNCGNTESHNYEFRAVDECGNTASAFASFNIVDTNAPVISIQASNAVSNCDGNGTSLQAWLNSNGGAAASDVCGNVTWSNTLISTTGTCNTGRVQTYRFTATDDCGLTAVTTATFTMTDNISPFFNTLPSGLTADCNTSSTALSNWLANNGGATASDLCGTVTWSNSLIQTLGTCSTGLINTYEFRATDECGNSTSATANHTVIDNTAPVWSNVPNTDNVECDGSGNQTELNNFLTQWTNPANAFDACTAVTITYSLVSSVQTGACAGVMEHTYRFTASDACGNTADRLGYFRTVDNTTPAITCPGAQTISCDAPSSPEQLGFPTVSDACSNVLTIHSDNDIAGGGCSTLKVRTWRATDGCGNVNTCEQYITLQDSDSPTLTRMPSQSVYEYFSSPNGACHQNMANARLSSDGTGCWQIVFDLFDGDGNNRGIYEYDGPCAVDNCGNVGTPALSVNRISSNGCFSVWRADWAFVDDCGNSTPYSQTFTFVDQASPEWIQVNPQLLSADCSDDINAIISANIPTVNENCTATVSEVNRDIVNGNCDNNYTWIVTYRAADACGNQTTSDFEVRIAVTDNTAPVWVSNLPGNDTVSCDGTSTQGVQTSWLNSWTDMNNASDACGSVVSIDSDLVNFSFGPCGRTGVWTYEFTATDDCGNSSVQTAHFVIEDDIAPTVTCPASVAVNCGDNIDPINTGTATALDVCSGACAVSYSDVSDFTDCERVTRTWSATDGCGNIGTCSQIIDIQDAVMPVLTTPAADVTFSLDATSNICSSQSTGAGQPGIWLSSIGASGTSCSQAIFEGYDANGNLVRTWTVDGPCASDNCSNINVGFNIMNSTNGCDFITDIVWSLSDNCGNVVQSVQRVTFTDTSVPQWVGATAISVNTDCSQDLNTIISDNRPNAVDNCGVNYFTISDITQQGSCLNNYTRIITYAISDDCGNTNPIRATLTLNVNDVTAPTWNVLPQDITAECIGNGNASGIAIWIAGLGGGQVSDMCGGVVTTATPVDTVNRCGATADYLFRFEASDACGNTATAYASYKVVDTSAPVITFPAQDLTVDCDGLGNTSEFNAWVASGGNATVIDGCNNNVTWTNELISSNTHLCNADTFLYRLIADDLCGGRDTTQARFIIRDLNPPILTGIPNDTIIDCSGIIPPVASVTALDCGPNVMLVFNETRTGGIPDTITRTWTATDCHGATSTGSHTITMQSTGAPTVVFCPGDIGPVVSQNGGCVVANWTPPTFNSGCPLTVTSTHNPGDCFPIGTTTVTYTATDISGNSVNCSFDVIVTGFCTPLVHNLNNFYIHKFVFNGVESTTGNNGGYANLTNISSTVTQGQTVVTTLAPGDLNGPSSTLFGFWRIWIDWNGDGDFLDAGETVLQLSGQGLIIAQVGIPATAPLGMKRMRVSFHHSQFLDPCDQIADQNGEMEDYTLFVLPPLKPASIGTTKTDNDNVVASKVSKTDFAATPIGEKVDLKWIADEEAQVEKFIIERSKDGISFTELMQVENNSNGTGELFYKTKDKNPMKGDNFYRLKQIFTDGTTEYSAIQRVHFGKAEIAVKFFPNPTSGLLNIEMPELIGKEGNVKVLNQLSQSLKYFELTNIEAVTQIDLSDLPDGIYYIQIKVGEMTVTEKILMRR